jgi:SAM-dependent methyltransferase
MAAPYDTDDRSDDPFALDPSDPAHPGQAAYGPATLRAYDTLIVRLSNTLVWRCPAAAILAHYNRHVTGLHLDVGPGTGYYLDRCRIPDPPRLTLLDPNPEVLRFAGQRLRRYRPAVHAADVLKPIGLPAGAFRSVGLSYVLHCLPGALPAKAVAFDHLLPLVEPGGVVFGTTILGRGVAHTRAGRALMRIYNGKGVFSNADDTLADLDRALAARFARHELSMIGAVALFAGWTE